MDRRSAIAIADSKETAFPKIVIPLQPGRSSASNRKNPSKPIWDAPQSSIVFLDKLAILIVRPMPIDRVARKSSMPNPPRISVNDLALFMVSSTTAQLGIIRRAKAPIAPPIIRYKDARQPIISYLTDMARKVNPLVIAEQMFVQRSADMSESSLRHDDAQKSIEVLRAIQGMGNQLAVFDFVPAPARQAKLTISGVEVSVHADMLVHAISKGVDQIGAAVLRMTQDDASTDAAIDKRRQMGLYVATLVRMHVDQNITSPRQATNRLCMSIDIQRGEAFVAPNSNSRRMSDLAAACQMIAALWPTA